MSSNLLLSWWNFSHVSFVKLTLSCFYTEIWSRFSSLVQTEYCFISYTISFDVNLSNKTCRFIFLNLLSFIDGDPYFEFGELLLGLHYASAIVFEKPKLLFLLWWTLFEIMAASKEFFASLIDLFCIVYDCSLLCLSIAWLISLICWYSIWSLYLI